ncbi:MAG TPA: HNH endonuclease [Candidatus Limnocylindria bacterium]|nr:HNH endonuclease [Candidatus Limnocylindria bacterium]
MAEPWTPVDPDALKRERAKARELRDSQWWKRRISTGICHYCRRQVGFKALTMDHIVPLGRGGASTRGNVAPACKECNNRKKGMLPVEWREYLDALGHEE